MDWFKRARANLFQNISMAIIMEVRGAAVLQIISGNIQVICITWSVPDLYLQPLPDRNPQVTRQDLNPKILLQKFEFFQYQTSIPLANVNMVMTPPPSPLLTLVNISDKKGKLSNLQKLNHLFIVNYIKKPILEKNLQKIWIC